MPFASFNPHNLVGVVVTRGDYPRAAVEGYTIVSTTSPGALDVLKSDGGHDVAIWQMFIPRFLLSAVSLIMVPIMA
jgi:hypothetical protein